MNDVHIDSRLQIDRKQLRQLYRSYGPRYTLPVLLWRQHWAERRLKRGGNRFRTNQNDVARDAYQQMNRNQFVDVNARQAWANWRCIPRSINGRLPDRPLQVIDLCCGTGDSTMVLASCCPPGSTILGLDVIPTFIDYARQRRYPDPDGKGTRVSFHVQSVLEPLHQNPETPVDAHSIDLINASGAVGVHFKRADSAQLAQHCAEVLRPGGIACIDAGKAGTDQDTLTEVFTTAGFQREHHTRSNIFDQYRHLCFRLF